MIRHWKSISLLFLAGTVSAQDQVVPPRPRQTMASPESQEPSEAPRLAVFEMRDLIDRAMRQSDWPAMTEAEFAKKQRQKGEALADILAKFVQPPLRENVEEIRYLAEGSLVAVVRWDQRQWIQDQLDRQRRLPDETILIEYRIVTAPKALAQRLELGPKMRVIEKEEDLLEKLSAGGADVLVAPRIMVFNGQRFQLSVSDQTAYVKEFQVHESVAPTGERLVDPVVDVINDGMFIDGSVLIVGDDRIAVDWTTKQVRLEKPIPEIETEHGFIGKPKVETMQTSSLMTVAPGATSVYVSDLPDGKVLIELTRFETMR